VNPYLLALSGGCIIGAAAAIFWVLTGRIAGISGIAGGLLSGSAADQPWRMAFVCGLLLGGALFGSVMPGSFTPSTLVPAAFSSSAGTWLTAFAGLLVGVGTKLGNGCTSGHGVCGIGRLSKRSLAATLVFMAVGFVTVYCIRLWLVPALGGGK
jgi:uncharacterized membrane protein YedE/YeeE